MEDKKCGSGECCHSQMSCSCGVGGKCLVWRWVLGIVILLVVFSLGFKLGGFKERVENGGFGYGRGMMYGHSWGSGPMMNWSKNGPGYGYRGMMQNGSGSVILPAPEQPTR